MHTARRTHGFTESVIREMTRVADECGAINLAQGFPDFPAPDVLKEAAVRAIRDDVNQYAVTWGAPRLRAAVAASYDRWYGIDVDPDREVTITCGATEAMAAVLLALLHLFPRMYMRRDEGHYNCQWSWVTALPDIPTE